ncbi:hypothetical protein [Nonomuraea sp. NPDC003804]|uniref:hypothetical protein n=1 Tax=Nonomuraea sp. NPDC003804 TaxID=3154547 RepID=UPI0033BA5BC1
MTLPNLDVDVFEETPLGVRLVHHIEAHRDHIRDQALADLATRLGERAGWLRSAPLALDDSLSQALAQGCHTTAGLISAPVSHVAAVAYEWLAKALLAGQLSDESGQSRTEDTHD